MEAKDAEVKEFWEGCGFNQRSYRKPACSHTPRCKYWLNPRGKWISSLPPIDLDNLSRYAIPKLIKEYRNWKSVLHDWVDELTGDYEKDALALFRSLYPIITGKEIEDANR